MTTTSENQVSYSSFVTPVVVSSSEVTILAFPKFAE